MEVTLRSYRDDANQIIDDLNVNGSHIDRLVVLRNDDGSITVRGRTVNDEEFESDFTVTNRQYTGLVPQTDDPIQTIHQDVSNLLATVGFTVEPTNVTIEESNNE